MNWDIDGLLSAADDATLAPDDALAKLADLIDLSGDTARLDGVEAALRWSERLQATNLGEVDRALSDYFAANAHAIRRTLSPPQGATDLWDDPDLEGEIRHLRLALKSRGFSKVRPYQRCQAQTNLGNALSRCGRLVEALEWYDEALAIDSTFGMAAANRGLTLVSYMRLVNEPARRNAFVREARADLVRSLALDLEEGATVTVKAALVHLESNAPAGFDWHRCLPERSFEGCPVEQRRFREWGLRHRLFLDELNDLSGLPIAVRDTLTLPSYVAPLGEGPQFIGFFNQIKQEFVAARWLLYDGSHSTGAHPADADVVLADTMDYPSHSFATEQIRLAFRSAYSLLDKVGFFLNHYLHLGIPNKRVEFRTLWFVSTSPRKRLRPEVVTALSTPLLALIWIAQDLYEPDSAYGEALLADAQDLWEIRRCLEHRYLKLHDDEWSEEWNAASSRDGLRDDLAKSLARTAFTEKTLRLLRMVRAVLIYLSWVMCVEEASRRSREPNAITPSVLLPPLPARE